MSAPLGQYDSSKLLNIGTNRWSIKPEVGVSKALGPLTLELDATDYTGWRTTVDGVKGDNLQENTRLGLTVALPVNRYNSIKLYASTGVFAHTGSNFNTGGIVWQFRWGGGL